MEFLDAVQNPSLINTPIEISSVSTYVLGGICGCETNKAWMVCGDCIEIINMKSGQCVQRWKCNYGEIYDINEVMCGTHQFLVVSTMLYSEKDTFVLVLLNILSLSIAKLIYFTEKVTSISSEILSSVPSNDNILRKFDGILAVGCCGGRVYLVSLNLGQGHLLHSSSPIKVVNCEEVIQEDICTTENAALLLLEGMYQ